jgi:hypothetical protein
MKLPPRSIAPRDCSAEQRRTLITMWAVALLGVHDYRRDGCLEAARQRARWCREFLAAWAQPATVQS